MDFIVNGDFESGVTEPWVDLDFKPLKWEIVSHNNKKWLHTYGLGEWFEGGFRQTIHKTEDLWDIHYRITFTAKAIPVGGTPQAGAQSEGGAKRLTASMFYLFTIHPTLDDVLQPGGSADVSVVEKTFTQRIVLTHFGPVMNGDLRMINWHKEDQAKADILITNIKLEKVDPETDPVDPEDSAENVSTLELPDLGFPKIKLSRMKEVK